MNKPLILRELIFQQYSSYDKNIQMYNIHLDGNLNATLHAICNDFKVMTNVALHLKRNFHLEYTITIPKNTKPNSLTLITNFVEGLEKLISNENVSLSIVFKNIKYRNSAKENRDNGEWILADGINEIDINEFDSISTNFEKSLDLVSSFEALYNWKSEVSEAFRILDIKKRRFSSRLNVSLHSKEDEREYLKGLEKNCSTLFAFSDSVTLHNQAQLDYIKNYYVSDTYDKFRLLNGKINKGFNAEFIEYQMSFYKSVNTIKKNQLIQFFENYDIEYIFPFRLTDPDWGFQNLTDEEKSKTVVTDPTNSILLVTDEIQKAFIECVRGLDKRTLLFTLFDLIRTKKIDVKIPLFSNPLNILHQTSIEILYLIYDNIDFRFDKHDTFETDIYDMFYVTGNTTNWLNKITKTND
ncbi:gp181 [Sphingomonas phage PAU]|uniref:gp181 n=1 Tax=Sphingomonas phage PAU TaxID=1150991 RepID=UPI0002573301|nr:gp181 [Sphingomonas phage PAU]AFF28179.1 gp181 [Sphingomonas phage PAU]